MEAQRYPGDYDGIIAGAPANYWTPCSPPRLRMPRRRSRNRRATFPAAKLPAIEAAALALATRATASRTASSRIRRPAVSIPPCSVQERGIRLVPDPATTDRASKALRRVEGRQRQDVVPRTFAGRRGRARWMGTWITGNAPEHSLMFAFGTQFFKNMVFEQS